MTTKQLAKQLGLIRRSSKLSLNTKSSSSPKSKQFFDFLIVIDFESTCWKDKKHCGQEIIEFPAVLLNTSNGEIESEFHTYVQPQEHPILSDFCTELTGIQQQQVDDGVPLRICLSQFSIWIQKLQKERQIFFPGVLPTPTSSGQKMCGFVTWSDWDLGVCLLYECRRKQLRKPDILNSWIDLRLTYKLFYNRKPKGLNGALQDVGIEFSGREHSGLDDSRNTARLAWRMICDGCLMKTTKSLDKVPPNSSVRPRPPVAAQVHKSRQGDIKEASVTVKEDRKEYDKTNNLATGQLQTSDNHDSMASVNQRKEIEAHQTLINGLSTTLGNDNKYRLSTRTSFGSIQIGAFTSTLLDYSPHDRGHVLMSTTVQTVNDVSALDMDSSSDLDILANWEEAAFVEDSQQEQYQGGNLEGSDLSLVDSPSTGFLMLKNDQKNRNNCQSMNGIGAANLHLKSVVYKSPDTTIYNIGTKKPASNGSAFKLPSALGNRTNAPASSTGQMSKTSTLLDYFPKRKRPSTRVYSPCKKLPFTIHEDQGNRSLPVTTSTSRVFSHKVLDSTVNLNSTFAASKSDRITAPMCQCGRRAKKLTVSNLGPNHGRVFYSCSVQKRNDENHKGCNYFKWEDSLLKEKSPNAFLSTRGICTTSNKSFISTGSSAASKPFLKLRPSMRT